MRNPTISWIRLVVSLPCAGLCGASWMLPIHWLGPLLSLGLVLLVLLQDRRWTRYLVAFSYYASASVGLVRGVAVFFGAHAPWWEGAFLWLGSSALLAVGWAFADRPWKAILVLLFDALVPPIAFFDWVSPLSAAGVLCPDCSWLGLIFLFLSIPSFAQAFRGIWEALEESSQPVLARLRQAGIGVLENSRWAFFLFFAVVMNILPGTKSLPSGWIGVTLQVGPRVPDIIANMERNRKIVQETIAQSRSAKVVLLPETLETAWAGNLWAMQRAVPANQSWLVGLSVPKQVGILTDSIVKIRHTGRPKVLFTSAFPVPVSMWHPWSRGTGYVASQNVGYEAAWWTPARTIDGVSTWANICYDQLLPFVWLEGLIQRPEVILLTNNEWWAKGTGIPEIQRNSSWTWARLMGAPVLESENY